jgi:hypothetical protein
MDSETLFLVERWKAFRDLLAPSRRLLLQVVGRPEFPHQDILQLGFFASRAGYWQVFCCLKRYCADLDQHPEGILESLPFQMMWNDESIWDRQSWAELHPFLAFCVSFDFVDPEVFLPSAYAIASTTPIQWRSFEVMCSATSIMEECMQLHPMPPDTWEDFEQCVRARRAKSAQVAALVPAW